MHEKVRRQYKGNKNKQVRVTFMQSPRHSKEKVNCTIVYIAVTDLLVMSVKKKMRMLCGEVEKSKDWSPEHRDVLRPYPSDPSYNPQANIYVLDLPANVLSHLIWVLVEQFQLGRMDAELYDLYKQHPPDIATNGENVWPRKVKDQLTQIRTKITFTTDRVNRELNRAKVEKARAEKARLAAVRIVVTFRVTRLHPPGGDCKPCLTDWCNWKVLGNPGNRRTVQYSR